MKIYTHFVFDIDGTLVDSRKVHLASLIEALKEVCGREYREEELGFSFGLPGQETMRMLGVADPKRGEEAWVRAYLPLAAKLGLPLYPGIEETLRQLSERGVRLGIITSKERLEYEQQFMKNGLSGYFSPVITSSDTPKGKPAPDPMLAYLRASGAKPEEVLYFGDTRYDMECARSAGVDAALALWGCANLEGIEATYRVAKPEDILAFAGGARE